MLKRLRDTEEGFTLIELLVVVIIIGILAAIAIPTFLSQRERGWQAEVTSHVRNAGPEIEAAATAANGTYPAVAAGQTLVDGFEDNGTVLTYAGGGAAFTICGVHPLINGGTNSIQYSSANGGLQPFSEANATCTAPAPPAT